MKSSKVKLVILPHLHENWPINCEKHLHPLYCSNHVICPALLLIDECEQNQTHLAANPVLCFGFYQFFVSNVRKLFLEKRSKKVQFWWEKIRHDCDCLFVRLCVPVANWWLVEGEACRAHPKIPGLTWVLEMLIENRQIGQIRHMQNCTIDEERHHCRGEWNIFSYHSK